jgi:hypothetical protein
MNKTKIASELLRIAKELVAGNVEDDIATAIRDHMSGINRFTTEDDLRPVIKRSVRGFSSAKFSKVFKELIEEGYLVESGRGYTWEM